jgi:3-dehydroquinate synthase
MEKITVELGDRSYPIYIGSGLLKRLSELPIFNRSQSSNILLSNPTVFGLYGGTMLSGLASIGVQCEPLLIPDGEEYKDIFWLYHTLTELLRRRLDRRSCVFALGGGVIGDMAGFAASVYMRGIPFVQIPTTLLAQVDSSVGGKTGVNHFLGKNMIGSFYQPSAVVIDTDTLDSLPKREYLCGIAEVIKYGVISDERFFDYLQEHREEILKRVPERLMHIIRTSCEIKARVVAADERESGLRAILNYGHTIGHAIETETNYSRFKHGEAVAIGMVLEAKVAEYLNLLDSKDRQRITQLIESYGLPSSLPKDIDPEALIGHMVLDKKAEAGRITVITPVKVGEVRITRSVDKAGLKEVLHI